MKNGKTESIPVVITTSHRGVFFGYVDERCLRDDVIDLRDARMVMYWPHETKGVLGLAAGPSENARISPPADMQIRDVTSVIRVTESGAKKFEAAPWKI